MSEFIDDKPSTSFWLIGGAALIWNLLGIYAYYMQVTATPDTWGAAGYSAEQIAALQAIPAWATGASGLATTCGVLASVLLLLRKSLAETIFMVSLFGLLLQNLHAFVLADTIAAFGMVPVYIQTTVMIIALLLIWYARRAKAKGWLS